MVDEKKTANYAAVMSTAAALTGVLNLLKNPVAAQAAGIPPELMQLLAAMAVNLDDVNSAKLPALLKALQALNIPGNTFQGWPANTEYITATRLIVPAAVAGIIPATQLPDVPVPDGMALLLKAGPLNTGIILIGESQAAANNVNQSWPLGASEMVWYYIQNANNIWFSGTVPGDFLYITVERRAGG